MAKGRVRKPSKTAPEAADSAQIAGPEQVSARPTGPSKKEARKTAQAERGLRKHIKRLEAQLADAAKAEAKKVKKLEKARWRRQLVEAFIDEAKSVASLRSRPAAAKSEATPATAEQVAPAVAAPKARTGRRAKATPAAESSVETPAAAAPAAATTVARPARASRKTAVKTAVADVAPTESPAEAALGADGAKPVEAYCLREKKRVQMLDPKPVQTANGGSALSGTCPSCGAALYKLVGRAGH